MAKCRQSIRDLLPGFIVAIFIATIVFSALIALWWFAFNHNDEGLDVDPYLQRVIFFTFLQAFWSTIISLGLAILLAKSLAQINFAGKTLFLRICSTTFAIPSLVVVIGLLSVYGSNGMIAQLCRFWGIDYHFSIYGLKGILLAHVFLNFPFATKIAYQALQLIPNEQKQLAQQLGFNYWQLFRYLELPVLTKQLLPLAGLIFMLCFASFAVVLALNGGPKYTTIEVAIYQAIRDFNLLQAVLLSLIQLFFCLSFMWLLKRMIPQHTPALVSNLTCYMPKSDWWVTTIAILFIMLSLLFILAPLIALILQSVVSFSLDFLTPALLKALVNSLGIAICSAILAMIQALLLLWTNSRLQLAGKKKLSAGLLLLGSLILAIPSMVLSSGLFILFFNLTDVPGLVFMLVVISNSLLALPFMLKNLAEPLTDLTKQYHLLSLSLNIQGLNYFYWIEYQALKRLLTYSFAFACVISLGDFGIIALFGNQDFMTLPYYLYELVSHYRYQEASLVALLLLIISYFILNLFEYASNDRT